ncbi:efflux RND transporter periplasmic adaptor subunit [Rhizobium rhizogenes]|uniref:Efflux RND transporter periplasmic adaptor subunit n=2 Tax=Rhizobiaceae TaxID=82115 RepID=A0A546XQ83_RHIRH|nr:efflux RND transporter periplasmic adaptor subunit [Rhizobium rhizogenes]
MIGEPSQSSHLLQFPIRTASIMTEPNSIAENSTGYAEPTSSEKRRRGFTTRLFWWGAAAAAFLGVTVWLMLAGEETPAAAQNAQAAKVLPHVSVVAAASYDFNASQDVAGLLAARNDISIGTAVTGQRIVEVSVDVGDTVAAGQLLARLESKTLAAQVQQTEANVARSRAALAEAEAAEIEASENLRRAEGLSGSSVSKEQLGQRRAAAAMAAAKIEGARAELAGTQAQLTQNRLELERTEILSPKPGVITQRYARIGAMPDSTEPLFRLLQDGELEFLAEAPERVLPSLQAGQSVTITVNGVSRPIQGTIRVVEPAVNTQSRLGIVRIAVSPFADLRTGAFARGKVDLGERRFRVAVPEAALRLRRGGTAQLVVVDHNDRVARRTVRLGQAQNGIIEILEGLEPAERVVKSASAFLRDGDQIVGVDEMAQKGEGR